jgi:SAM-dependent methyltransferase
VSVVQPPERAATGQGLRFGEVAELYERRRPGYPGELFADVLSAAGPPFTVLEVGAGTGKATRQLIAAGATVTAVEPDASMAAVMRREGAGTEGLPDPVVAEGTFEALAEQGALGSDFGVVTAAQAWHWVDQRRGPELARRLLRPGGVLAVFWNTPVDCVHYDALIDVYRRRAPHMAPGMATAEWDAEMERRRAALAETEGFGAPEVRNYDWTGHYSPEALAELVRTYSGHRLLEPSVLDQLTEEVAAMVEEAGGEVALDYRVVLLMVRRRD